MPCSIQPRDTHTHSHINGLTRSHINVCEAIYARARVELNTTICICVQQPMHGCSPANTFHEEIDTYTHTHTHTHTHHRIAKLSGKMQWPIVV